MADDEGFYGRTIESNVYVILLESCLLEEDQLPVLSYFFILILQGNALFYAAVF